MAQAKMFLLAQLLLSGLAAPTSAAALSCQDDARARVATPPTVYYDSFTVNSNNDGMSATTPMKVLQHAFDCAANRFDVKISYGSWVFDHYPSYRPGVIVQVAPAAKSNPHVVPNLPVFLDGLGASGPIYVQGNCEDPNSTWIDFHNQYQGFTSQDGAALIVRCLGVMGNANITLINCLANGRIAVDRVRFAQAPGRGPGGVLGAANQCGIDVIGDIWLDGPAFISIFQAITLSKMTLGQAPIHIDNANTNLGILYALGALSTFTHEGGIVTFTGSGVSTVTGQCYSLDRGGVLDFPYACPFSYSGSYAGPGTWFGTPGIYKDMNGWHTPPNTD